MNLEILRHSCSHIMAQAVKELFPGTKLGIGPAIEEGFYYDFDKKEPFTPQDLSKIEERMREIIEEDLPFIKEEMGKAQAIRIFKELGEDYKVELLQDLKDEKVSIYKTGEKFIDLCKGPHLKSTGEIRIFKLLSIAGAYWRGIETNPMLQRIYGTAFEREEELSRYLEFLEEAKKRDHRYLGKELGIFSFYYDEAGSGLVFYQPKGAILRTLLEDFIKKEHLKRGYQIVITPHIMRKELWQRSGHYDYYRDNIYTLAVEDQEYVLKPMNCPGHILIYKSKIRSYRDLPLRLFELGTVYRHEKAGVLHGLLRVRGFTQDDAHIFCLPQQIETEITGVIDFVLEVMHTFGFDKIAVELSTRPLKYIGKDEDWEQATSALEKSLQAKGLDYKINPGEGAFYGPKIDIKLKDALGRAWQCATIQCDFALPQRFDLDYIAEDGSLKRPIMLHRVVLGSLERFMGALIEHYAGKFPIWISPVQISLIPISMRHHQYARSVKETLEKEDLRVELDLRNERMEYKIREAQLNKIPYMLIVGEREAKSGQVGVRHREDGDLGAMTLEGFIEKIKEEIVNKD